VRTEPIDGSGVQPQPGRFKPAHACAGTSTVSTAAQLILRVVGQVRVHNPTHLRDQFIPVDAATGCPAI